MSFFHAFLEVLAVFDNAGFNHFPQQIIALAGTLADTGKNRESVMFLRNVVDKFLDEHRLADSRATEKTDLAAFQIRFEKVNDFDSGVEDFL